MSQALKAVVRDGNISTDLQDDAEVSVVIVKDAVDFAEPWMDEVEARAFNDEMRASLADIDAGRVVDGEVLFAELRARAHAS